MPHSLTNFSRAKYAALLDDFKSADYQSLDFPAAAQLTRHDQPWLILRHDIDFDVPFARDIALVEAGKNFTSTFFFLLRTPFYNLFTAENTNAVREIISAGHQIGLHYDRMAYPPDTNSPANIRREAAILADWFQTQIKVISYHRPIAKEIEGHPEGSAPYLNTYMEQFTKRIAYISDSQGAFRFGHPLDHEAFQNRKPIQLLTHPIWWGQQPTPPLEVLKNFAASRAEINELEIAKNCKVYRVGKFENVTG